LDTVESLAQHAALVAALCDPAAFPHPTGPVESIETHISTVVLAGEFAYKLKKPVNLGFVDFSTLPLRHRFCLEEIRLNRRGAPDLYLDVLPITGTLRRPRIGESAGGAAIEYAVRMRRFAADARLDQVARSGRLTPELVDRLAAAISGLHARCERAPVDRGYGSVQEVRLRAVENLCELARGPDSEPMRDRIADLRTWTESELTRRAPDIAERQADGHVRECHGDLHLGNLVLLGDAPVPFDCIEFNDRLRFIDVINDVAFTFMDLAEHDLVPLAWRLIGAYLEHTGDYPGLALLRFYTVYRALVRAKIARIRLHQDGTRPAEQIEDRTAVPRYIEAAAWHAAAGAPRLILTCGLAGSGKTTVAQTMLERLGAVRVRSDVERKRLAGVDPAAHRAETVEAGLYRPDLTRVTYERLAQAARAILDARFPAIVDATFIRRSDRQAFRDLARQAGVPFSIISCEAPPTTLRARIERRLQQGSDPSDATREVLEHQLRVFEPLTPDEQALTIRIDTDTDRDGLQRRAVELAARLRALAPGSSPASGTGEK